MNIKISTILSAKAVINRTKQNTEMHKNAHGFIFLQ